MQLLDYFHEAPSPLASDPLPYDEKTVYRLMERLRPYDLTKAEMLMIMNIRPTRADVLNAIVEELETRFDQTQQNEITEIVIEVLGQPDGEAERQALVDSAESARKEHDGHPVEGSDGAMEVD